MPEDVPPRVTPFVFSDPLRKRWPRLRLFLLISGALAFVLAVTIKGPFKSLQKRNPAGQAPGPLHAGAYPAGTECHPTSDSVANRPRHDLGSTSLSRGCSAISLERAGAPPDCTGSGFPSTLSTRWSKSLCEAELSQSATSDAVGFLLRPPLMIGGPGFEQFSSALPCGRKSWRGWPMNALLITC